MGEKPSGRLTRSDLSISRAHRRLLSLGLVVVKLIDLEVGGRVLLTLLFLSSGHIGSTSCNLPAGRLVDVLRE